MAAMIPAGVAIALPLAAGSVVLATGVGTAQLAPLTNGPAPRLHPLSVSQSTIGPVSTARTLNLYADPSGSGINYTIVPDGGVPSYSLGAVQTVGVIGDSLTWNGSTGITSGQAVEGQAVTSTNIAYTARNLMQLVATQMNQAMRVREFGVSGERTDQYLARFDTTIATVSPSIVVVQGCSNDFDQFKTALQVYANVVALWQKAKSIGARLVFINTSCGNFSTQAIADEWYKFHALMSELHKAQVGFYYVPPYPIIVDYSTNTNAQLGVPQSGMLKDSRHYAALGAYTSSKALVPFFTSLCPAPLPGPGGANWVAGSGDQYSTYIRNGVFGGPGAAASGGPTGTDPTFWASAKTGGITLAVSLAARTDGRPGQWAVHNISGATATSDAATLSSVNGNNSGVAAGLVGQTGAFEIDIDATASTGTFTRLDVQCYALNSSSSTLLSTGMNMAVYISGTLEVMGYSSLKGRLRSPLVTIPAGADRLRFVCTAQTSVNGVAVVKWGDADFKPEAAAI